MMVKGTWIQKKKSHAGSWNIIDERKKLSQFTNSINVYTASLSSITEFHLI